MKIIVVSDRGDRSYSFHLTPLSRALMGIFFLLLLSMASLLSYQLWQNSSITVLDSQGSEAWVARLDQQGSDVEALRESAQRDLSALTLQLANLQSRLLRLDALGQRVAKLTKLDSGEFDFSATPAVGGPAAESEQQLDYQPPAFMDLINQMSVEINDREQQLRILEDIISNKQQANERFISGRPIVKGWMSSPYGHRTDPFSGKIAMHHGIDFAGEEGSSVIAVAGGVVTWAGRRSGYGVLVEINHGDGYKTRYAHNAKVLVKVGDIVKKGDAISLMGSTGRSTGPHVHFEVLKNDAKVNPARFVYRASR
ncbi:peptidase M23-like protein [Sinobacterium caligoides]|uniref:Peptidase M23-like protein n=1 Tax=Sinobacterium caligoides TaxID=933926 RepID=A0A3N2D5L0_9GAMM|nr:M23 family metallopeptidase [Sinobacterium caligoides]ROR94774.1 peptidase M23-like protein [Sinobacterium caligoides]